ncbi:MAG: MarR family winged helix-turn-helix transcriptional regulator [Alphaproteobacteria bacterium]|nr:MarR family winged helix-turn-helix transcriptional regulator [Alphaproteobacteria bacterium]
MMRLIEFVRTCEKETGTRLVTFDFEILFFLYVHGPSPSMTVLEATSASLAAFVKALKRLTEEGMLIVEQGKADRRVRNYDLAPDVRALLAENLNRLLASGNAN